MTEDFQGGNVDHTMFPPVCLPNKMDEFVGTASVYGEKISRPTLYILVLPIFF